MVAAIKHDAVPTYTNRISTGANSLADGSSVLSSAIDPTASLDQFINIPLILASINPSGAPYTEIHILETLDNGTNYPDINAGTLQATIPMDAGSSAKEGIARRIEQPPNLYKIGLVNRSGVSWASSGNTAGSGPFNDEVQ